MYIDIVKDRPKWQDLYKLAVSAVTPRPIAFVSTVSATGIRNLAPFSFFNMVSCNPPILMFCPARTRDGNRKDTRVNIEETKEFVVGTVNEPMAEAMNQASAVYPPEIDEFLEVGFTPKPAKLVSPAIIGESPVNFECLLHEIMEFESGPGGGCAIFGKVVAIHADDKYLADDGLVDHEKCVSVGRLGRDTFSKTTNLFDLPRPKV